MSCKPESINLGYKTHLTNRLNQLLGEDLQFTKRGFFASGQNHLPRKILFEDWHPYLKRRFGNHLKKLASTRLTSAVIYYRFYILSSWLDRKCK